MSVYRPDVEDITKVDNTQFSEIFFNNTTPVQYRNIASEMPAYKKWNFDFFKENCKEMLCQVSDDLNDPANITRKISISEYIQMVQDGKECPYMTGWSYQKSFPSLDDDIFFPEFHPEDFIEMLPKRMQFRRRWIFFGKKGINCDLHIDCFSTSAWLLMIEGQKTFRAISPLDRHNIDMGASLFDSKVVEHLNKHGVNIVEFTLTPGTILYVPTGWVHEIRNDSDNIMVTGGFTSQQHAIRFYKNYHSYISRDALESDLAFNNYLKMLAENDAPLSNEVINSIEEEVSYTQEKIDLLMQKKRLYESMIKATV
ncbi:cupin-like domain-containing protein [Pantoea sp. Mb-10]|uniref:cupin-like domain-containing protein n=1 Tax=unclassified Pantoea TaxID=2630326 RepID=UPI001E44871C|nr:MULTISPECIES: cupin-like domain-containing protein [unclassified Pantoea]MCE0490897.1 cupin-like domain-containing protein [Pantoea sp. Mb-10]MCE0499945.1 cupin-like domain-containing protein [Pantoea sp. Pb-8]